MPEGQENPEAIPLKDLLQSAKQTLREGNDATAIDVVRAVAADVGKRMEHNESSRDPQAYTLRRIIVARDLWIESVRYLIEPPEAIQNDTGISMVYIENGQHESSNRIRLLNVWC